MEMIACSPSTLILPVTNATPENIAPYGQLISVIDPATPLDVRFYEDNVSVGRVEGFVSDDKTELSVVAIKPRPFQLLYLERHFLHTQVFLPLSDADYIVVLGRPESDDLPAPDAVEAFRIRGDTGLLLSLRTWHEFPFVTSEPASMLVILRSETTKDLCETAPGDSEAIGPDLEKRDLLKRWPCAVSLQP